eukprot:gb/GEZN01005975.1/.p1 GENE.gb/GEZN01005975.1/~~gb/GEZN01005975.1/.p1  ORF type:complete len:565 (+),score=91.64 gb/GEZN01005975.1/:28-1722(+)
MSATTDADGLDTEEDNQDQTQHLACALCQASVVPEMAELKLENQALRQEIFGLKERIKAFDNRITSFTRTMGQLTLHVNAIVSGLHKLDAHGIRAEAEKRRKRREQQEEEKAVADALVVTPSSLPGPPSLSPENSLTPSPLSSSPSSTTSSPGSSPSSSSPPSPFLGASSFSDGDDADGHITPLSIHAALLDSKVPTSHSPRVAASPRKNHARSRSFSREGSVLRRRNSEHLESSTLVSRNTPGLWKITTFIGGSAGFKDGPRLNAQLQGPCGVAVGPKEQLYFCDTGNNKVRILLANGNVITLAGTGQSGSANGPGSKASFSNLRGLVVDKEGRVFLTDNDKIRTINPKGVVSTLLDGAAEKAFFSDITRDHSGTLYFSDQRSHRIFKITKRSVSVVAGSGQAGLKHESGEKACFNQPAGLAVDAAGETLYVADSGNNMIRIVNLLTGAVSALAGSGTAGDADGSRYAATFTSPQGIALDNNRSVLYVVEGSHRLRQVAVRTGEVVTLAGTGAAGEEDGESPAFSSPMAVDVDKTSTVFVADTRNHRIRKAIFWSAIDGVVLT